MEVFKGNYREYVAAREAAKEAARAAAAPPPPPKNPQPKTQHSGLSQRERQKRIVALEEAIHDLEVQMVQISGDLEAASAAGEVERVRALGAVYTATQAAIEAKMEEWETLLAS
jgi:hypothetical protein